MAETTAERIAREFRRELREWIGDERTAEVNRLNRTPEYASPVCASHDFCDANEAMAAAFEKATGREPRADSEDDAADWNAAWQIAHRDGFEVA